MSDAMPTAAALAAVAALDLSPLAAAAYALGFIAGAECDGAAMAAMPTSPLANGIQIPVRFDIGTD